MRLAFFSSLLLTPSSFFSSSTPHLLSEAQNAGLPLVRSRHRSEGQAAPQGPAPHTGRCRRREKKQQPAHTLAPFPSAVVCFLFPLSASVPGGPSLTVEAELPVWAVLDPSNPRREFWCPLYRVFGGRPIAQCFEQILTSGKHIPNLWGGFWMHLAVLWERYGVLRCGKMPAILSKLNKWQMHSCQKKIRQHSDASGLQK